MKASEFRKLIREEINNVLNEAAITPIDKNKMTAIAKLISDTNLFPELKGNSVNRDSSMDEMKDTIAVIVKLPTVLSDKGKWVDFVKKMRNDYGSDQVIWMMAENGKKIKNPKLNSVFSELHVALNDLRNCFSEFRSFEEFQKTYNRLAKAVDKVLAAMGKK
jgi:allantoicase